MSLGLPDFMRITGCRKSLVFEKRRAHLSSLILTGQMGRDEALARLQESELNDDFIRNELDFVAGKLDEQARIIVLLGCRK